MSGPLSKGFQDIEGVVKRVDLDSLVFRIGHETEDVTIPRACVENFDQVEFGDNFITVSRNFLKRHFAEARE